MQIDDVRVEDGTLRFTDERTGKVQQVSAVNLKLGLDSLQSPLTGSGNLSGAISASTSTASCRTSKASSTISRVSSRSTLGTR